MSTPATIRAQVHALADQLPSDATWEDVRHQVEFRASVEKGLQQSLADDTISHEEVLKEFGIEE